ncbi:ExbD/TolR family protein [Caulobacter sp. S45]|uniref:ExbD/TolR family protein n=1 Tax=Caulobacter sp. S45 TaxID=1641861 RepID=UPI00131BAE26|nr:ExbD/TolR family protein [Caulobacter sp. S45]
MALSVHDALSTGRRGRRRRRGRAALSEINVTPLVDVMLVLLIIFMVSAPLLTAGVPLELPKTDAAAISTPAEPVTVSVQKDGRIYVGENETDLDELADRVKSAGGAAGVGQGGESKPLYVRADGAASYAVVAQVMARLSTSGFSAINLITDTGGAEHPAKRADTDASGQP